MTSPRFRTLLVAVSVSVIGALVGPSAVSSVVALEVPAGAATIEFTTGAQPGVGDTLPEPNVFLPDERNLSDCLSSLPKPDCGSPEQGGPGQLLTFGALMLGMAFIGWRVFRSVKRRDASTR